MATTSTITIATVSQPKRQYSETGGEICTLCCEESGAWAIGSCDHFVCLICSARLRIICGKKECPICRETNETVVVFTTPRGYFLPQTSLKDRRYGFMFSKSSLLNYYDTIKALRCTRCNMTGGLFNMRHLADHTRREHGLLYCEICVAHLKLFPSEHKLYTRQDLVRHRREGDLDDKSHKGHPQCEFCDERYFGKDELFFHLKKNHFWCHFCEQSGAQDYYQNYEALKGHFRKDHYLCEEGSCHNEKFTNVFLSKLDLQVHKAKVHTRGLSKTEAKQLRQLDVGFTYARAERRDGGAYRRQYQQQDGHMSEQRNLETAVELSLNQEEDYRKEKGIIEQKPVSKEGGVSRDRPREGGVSKDKPKEGIASKDRLKVRVFSRDRPKEGGVSREKPKDVGISRDILKEGGVSRDRLKEGGVSRDIFEEGRQEPIEGLKENLNYTHDPPIKLERKKPPGLEHVEPVMAVVCKETDQENKEEWPTLGLESSKNTILVTSKGPPGLPVLPPPPGFTPTTNIKSVPSSEFSVLDEAKRLLKRDPDRINNFKSFSGQYQKGRITVFEYNKKCSDLFGHVWKDFGCRLASTLPDMSRRQELLTEIINNNNHQSVNRVTRQPPPGFTSIDKSSNAISIDSSNSKKAKKKRNRYNGNTDYSNNSTSTANSSAGVWKDSSDVPTNNKVLLKDSEYPTLGVAAHMPDPSVSSLSPWSMKVVVK